jgi:RNA polymerase sigma-70 factor, ECF subfamily
MLPMPADHAIDDYYHTHHAAILAYLRGLVRDHATAEDLCQETFLKAWRGWWARDPRCSLRAWLYRIATNTAYDELRRRRRLALAALPNGLAAVDPRAMPEAGTIAAETVQQVLIALPAHERAAFVLQVVHGYDLQEIATIVGCPVGTVKSRLHRARARLQHVYQAAEGVAPRRSARPTPSGSRWTSRRPMAAPDGEANVV